MSQFKFGRNYYLSVELSDKTELNITLPFTVEFNIIKNILTSANICQIRIYNLDPISRNLIRFDISNYGTVRKVTLNAGYGMNTPLVFTGNITQAWSFREGTDFITTIECFDGGDAFVNATIPNTATFPNGTPMQTVYKTLMGYCPNTSFGAIGDSFIYDKSRQLILTTRSSSYTGNAVDALRSLVGTAFFIDNGKTYILGNNECTRGQIAKINSQSGLLSTPLREQNIVTFDMIFEPNLSIGQLINLESLTFPQISSSSINSTNNVNGNYKIVSVKHKCVISGSVCGDAITTLEFFGGLSPLTRVT